LESVAGVEKVEIDFDSKTATCQVNPEKFDAQVALTKLTEQDQFQQTSLSMTK